MTNDTENLNLEQETREHVTQFDTQKIYKSYRIGGFNDPQAEVLVEQNVYVYNAVMEKVATKQDLESGLKILELKITAEIAQAVRSVQITVGFITLTLGLVLTLTRLIG